MPDVAAGRSDPTLGQVVEALGAGSVTLLSGPGTAVARVGGPRLWDAADVAALAPGDLVLGVNVAASAAAEVIGQLAQRGVAGLALKGERRDLDQLVQAAESAGVGLLAVSAEMTWDQVYGLVQRAATSLGPAGDEQPGSGDLFAYANALAALIGGAVAIEDPGGNLLAYSNLDQEIDEPRRQTILGRRNPSSWAQLLEAHGFYRDLAMSPDGPIRVRDPEGRANDRVVTLVRAGHEVLGSIWVVAGTEPLRADAEALLRDATPLAALHLLRQRTHHDSTRRERGALLRAVLAGEVHPGGAGGLGIDVGNSCQVVGFHLATLERDDVALAVSRTRVVDAVTMACEAFRRRVVCAWVGRTIYAVFPDVPPGGAVRLGALAEDICRQMTTSLAVEVVAGISATRAGLAAVPESREEVDRVLRVLSRDPARRRVAAVDDVRIDCLLLALGDLVREHDHLRVPGVGLLAEHDVQYQKSYLPTLQAFIHSAGNITSAAVELGIHPNTMRYRVARIEEISGLSLSDPDHRLVAALELLVRSAT